MTRRRVTYIPERTGAGIVRLRKVELPATGVDGLREIARHLDQVIPSLDRRLAALEQRYGARRRPAPPRAPR